MAPHPKHANIQRYNKWTKKYETLVWSVEARMYVRPYDLSAFKSANTKKKSALAERKAAEQEAAELAWAADVEEKHKRRKIVEQAQQIIYLDEEENAIADQNDELLAYVNHVDELRESWIKWRNNGWTSLNFQQWLEANDEEL